MKKRVLSAALSLCLLLTLLPTAALATGDETTDPGTSPASKTLQEEINTAENGPSAICFTYRLIALYGGNRSG